VPSSQLSALPTREAALVERLVGIHRLAKA
jgi:hypothetical protein